MVGQNQGTPGFRGMARFSHLFMAGLLLVIIVLHLATPLLAALFSYLALTRFSFSGRRGKWLAVVVFLALLGAMAYGLGFFINQAVRALPEIADKAIPSIIDAARQKGIELPFTDYDTLRDFALDSIKGEMRYLASAARFARGAAAHLLFLVAGCVVAISIFLNPHFELGPPPKSPSDLYSIAGAEIARRFQTFYQSFVTVMGAQIVIAAINMVLSTIFVLATGMPYWMVVAGVTFLCGLVPVVGNLISNTIVVAIGFTISPKMALVALIFLVAIHKLEYFLNSKIIGWRIRNPVWLTLLALIVGERLLGIPGMILAPIVLNYIKLEASRIKLNQTPQSEALFGVSAKSED